MRNEMAFGMYNGKFIAIFLQMIFAKAASEDNALLTCFKAVLHMHVRPENRVGFIYSYATEPTEKRLTHREDRLHSTNKILAAAMETLTGSLYLWSSMHKVLKDIYQKNNFLDTCIFHINYNSIDIFKEAISLVKSLRIIGPTTNLLIILDIKNFNEPLLKYFSIIWENIAGFYSTILVQQGLKINFFSFSPYDSKKEIKIFQINSWEGGFQSLKIFENLPKNFKGFPLKVGFMPRPPYILKSNKPGIQAVGPEPKFVLTIAETLNIKADFQLLPESPLNVYKEENFQGIWKTLNLYQLDVALMAFPASFESSIPSSPLSPYDYNTACFLVPKIAQKGTWRLVVDPFEPFVWLSIFISTIIIIFIFYLGNILKEVPISDVVFTIIRLQLESASDSKTLDKLSQLLMLFFLLYGFLTSNYYKSKVTVLHTIPPQPYAVKSLGEAYETGLIFYSLPRSLTLTNRTDHELWNKIMQKGHFETYDSYGLMAYKAAIQQTGYLFVPIATGIYIMNDGFGEQGGENLISIIPYGIMAINLNTCFSPGNPLQPIFNEKQSRLLAGGFLDIWLRQIMNSLKLKIKVSGNHAPQSIKLNEISGIIYVYFFSLGLSITGFLLENVFWHFKVKKRTKKSVRRERVVYFINSLAAV